MTTSHGMQRPKGTVAGISRHLAALVLLAGLGSARVVQGEAPTTARVDEYRLKAAILYNIARFVEWPSAAFGDAGSPVVVCVIGADPFGDVLDQAVRGRTIGARAMVIRRLPNPNEGCHIVFIAYSEQKRVSDIIERLAASSTLTISEVDRFTERGGVVGLASHGDRIRFDINADAADRAKLIVSARLLALASAVRRAGGPGR
jgi:hypothetical protein